MEYICRVNWKEINTNKQLQEAILEWTDRGLDDVNSLTRVDILKLISIHGLENDSNIIYDPESGTTKIEIIIDAKIFYGISSKWNLTFNFPEFGDHCISMYVDRKYGEINKEEFYKYTHDIKHIQNENNAVNGSVNVKESIASISNTNYNANYTTNNTTNNTTINTTNNADLVNDFTKFSLKKKASNYSSHMSTTSSTPIPTLCPVKTKALEETSSSSSSSLSSSPESILSALLDIPDIPLPTITQSEQLKSLISKLQPADLTAELQAELSKLPPDYLQSLDIPPELGFVQQEKPSPQSQSSPIPSNNYNRSNNPLFQTKYITPLAEASSKDVPIPITTKDPSKIFRNKISHILSRNIPPLTLLKDHFKEAVSKSFKKSSVKTLDELNETVEMVQTLFQHSLTDFRVMSNIDSIIHSSTNDLLAQYMQITEKISWEQTSQAYKDKGNELFQKRFFSDAIILYNEALRLHSLENNQDTSILSSIHSNRCLCLVNLEHYEAGAAEATRGIEINSSARLLHKLHYRRGICYYHLKKHSKAKKDFLRAHKLIEKMDSTDISSIESYLYKIKKLNLPLHEEEKYEEQLAKEKNVSGAATVNKYQSIVDSRVDLKYESDKVGRITEANSPIPENSLLFQERPYVSCLDRNYHSLYCYNCFKELLVPVYCKGCNNAQYCGDSCLKEDYKNQHSVECDKGFLLTCSHESLLVIRILIKKAKEYRELYGEPNNNNSKNNNNNKFENGPSSYIPTPVLKNVNIKKSNNKFDSNNLVLFDESLSELQNLQISRDDKLYEIPKDKTSLEQANIYLPNYEMINSFDPHILEHSNENLLSLIFDSLIIERFIGYYQKELGILPEDINISTILRHLCQLTTYTFAIPGFIYRDQTRYVPEQESPSQNLYTKYKILKYIEDKIGYAIYPMSSLMNHSCVQNTHLQYKGNTIVIKSLCDIEKGEEILGCYGPSAFLHPLRDRIVSLYKEYFFICRCKACSEKAGPDQLKCPGSFENNSNTQCSGTLLEKVSFQQLINKAESESKNSLSSQTMSSLSSFSIKSKKPLPVNHQILSNYEQHEDYENRVFICNKCGIELYGIDAHSLTSQVIISDNLFNAGVKALNKNNYSKEIENLFLKSLEIRRSLFKVSSKKIGDVYDALVRYFLTNEAGYTAALYLEKFIENISIRLLHNNSSDLGREYAKLGEVYLCIGEFSKSEKAIKKAEEILLNWRVEPSDDEVLFLLVNHKKLFSYASQFSI
ncbi:hypothetical protein DICPUDRAFT_147450 [Dictyostelium purpureum]|uniref:Protein-lysine N-methyltransferase SMYD4 n=1 Tax=Dictyostelium purpureum TaxID=5786 RepID=F0Z8I3_DICPU|nr:uncharacterized protein DICPUDRAFT_147450 [Dictyostelium purpureum]EGC39762.1 hypothetical protein DICPUDRAFT_147450 [Dictyostelium purpureum]|eukprot:XP_003283748.1 hypothetical protein DICPUDRAFT_147450 [Dictyostelium purpureum]